MSVRHLSRSGTPPSVQHLEASVDFTVFLCSGSWVVYKNSAGFGASASTSSSAATTSWDFQVLTSPWPSCWAFCVLCAWKYSVKRLTAIP